MTDTNRPADVGFHPGELTVQARAGVAHQADRLSGMLEPVALEGGIAEFLADRTLLVVTGRDAAGQLWTSPLVGPPGFLRVLSDTRLAVRATFPKSDPLSGLAAGQKLGMTAVEFAARRRLRINGTLAVAAGDHLVVEVEQAYGNCPQYIQPRLLAPDHPSPTEPGPIRRGTALTSEDAELVRTADTFFLGTINPERGADASHRGGPPGFVRIDEIGLWWPDYKGNNLFNSLGNLAVDPEAALLFFDFTTGRTLQLSGRAQVEWGQAGRPGDDGHTGRIVRFTPQHVVAGRLLAARQVAHHPYPRNPALTD